MHMADALLSPAVGLSFWAGSATTLALCSRRLRDRLEDRALPFMGVLGAFIFTAQLFNFIIPGTGSSGHLGGGLLLAILLGPEAGFLVIASVLAVQAFLFADGGLVALGCNIWNLGFYPCFIAYPLVYKPLAGKGEGRGRNLLATLLAGVLGLQLGSISVVAETFLSGRVELPFATFALLMQPIHFAIGIVEGLVTAGIVVSVNALGPRSPAKGDGASQRPRPSLIPIVFLGAATILVALLLGSLASTLPDGLEWALEASSPRASGGTGPVPPAVGLGLSNRALAGSAALIGATILFDAVIKAARSWKARRS